MSDTESRNTQEGSDAEEPVKKKKMSKKKKLLIALGILAAILVILAGAVYVLGHHYYAKTNYLTDEEAAAQIEAQRAAREAKEAAEEEEETDPELLAIQQNLEQYASDEPITSDGNVYNVMLVGLDTTTEDFVGNSDSMILVSINYRLGQISMISLMRDTYVDIPGVGYRKLNATYPNGGGPLLCQTVTENYKIQVDRYVTVDFGGMIDIIDEIGTIEITFTEKEAENANKSIKQQCRIRGEDADDYLIPGEGTYQCNGMQAVAYARIRKVGNADYQRTERQREVLMKLLEKVKAMSLDDIDRLANRLLPMLTHNIPESEFWGLLAKVPSLLTYDIVQDRVPYDGMFQSVNGNLVPEWDSTIRRLKTTIYGEDAVDEEGNVIITPEPSQVSESQGALKAQTYSEESGRLTVREQQCQKIRESLIPEKKAAVVADNVPGGTVGEKSESASGEGGTSKEITNPYVGDTFVLQVPNAPLGTREGLINGSYEWELPEVGSELFAQGN